MSEDKEGSISFSKCSPLRETKIWGVKFILESESTLDDEYAARVVKELRETPENVEEGLRILRELIAADKNLRIPTDDESLKRFLRPCKWYAESAFGLLKRFYKYRLNHPRFFNNLIPSNEKIIITSGILTPMPKRTAKGVRMLLIEAGKKWKPKEITLEQIFRGVILYLLAVIVEPKSQIAGVRVIVDMDGLSLTQVTYFTPSFAAAVTDFVQRCLPCRLKGIHIINQPFVFNMVFALFKPFLEEKIRKRIHFHGTDRNSLFNYIDAQALPSNYGGELQNISNEHCEELYDYIHSYEEAFIESAKYGYLSKE